MIEILKSKQFHLEVEISLSSNPQLVCISRALLSSIDELN